VVRSGTSITTAAAVVVAATPIVVIEAVLQLAVRATAVSGHANRDRGHAGLALESALAAIGPASHGCFRIVCADGVARVRGEAVV
jgi:hypothetical protein